MLGGRDIAQQPLVQVIIGLQVFGSRTDAVFNKILVLRGFQQFKA